MKQEHKKTARFYRQARIFCGFKKGAFAKQLELDKAHASLIESGERGLSGRKVLEIIELKKDFAK